MKTKILGITLPNGYHINPVVLDCSLGIDGAGPPGLFGSTVNKKIDRVRSTTILKSITRDKEEGNFGAPWWLARGWAMTDYYIPLPKKFCYLSLGTYHAINSIGLTNEGFDETIRMDFHEKVVNISIFIKLKKGTEEDIIIAKEEAIYMAKQLSSGYTTKGYKIGFVVLNISCPNDKDSNGVCVLNDSIVEVIKAFKEAIDNVPVGVKYSYMQDIKLVVAIDKNVDIAFHQAINTIPTKIIYGENSFISKILSHIGGGGVSGEEIREKALEYGKDLFAEKEKGNIKAPLILGGGISNLEDAIERAKYADVIAIGILVNKDTKTANEIIEYFSQGVQENEHIFR
jgi:dihydroorotate dehydrogenase